MTGSHVLPRRIAPRFFLGCFLATDCFSIGCAVLFRWIFARVPGGVNGKGGVPWK